MLIRSEGRPSLAARFWSSAKSATKPSRLTSAALVVQTAGTHAALASLARLRSELYVRQVRRARHQVDEEEDDVEEEQENNDDKEVVLEE